MTTASLRRSSAWPAPRYAQSHARRSGYTKGEGSGVSTWRVQSSPSWILSRRRRSRGTSNASVKHSRRVSATTGNSARPPTASRSGSDDPARTVGDPVRALPRLSQPLPHRRGRVRVQATLRARPFREVRSVETVGGVAAEAADGEAELPGTGRMLPLPERDRRRHTLRVLDEHTVGADLDDPPRVRAEEEDVAREALGDELLVERADLEIGLGDEDVEEPRVGDRPARGEGEEAAAAPRVEAVVHAVPEDAWRGALDHRRERLGERAHDGDEILPRQSAVRRGVPEALPERVDAHRLGGDRGDDLLRQDVQRGLGHRDPVELLIADRARHRSRLAELLAPGDDDPPLRHAGEEVARAAHALKGRGDVAGRLELHDQVDRADVDPELEGRRGGERLELALLEPVLGLEPGAAGQGDPVGSGPDGRA